MTKERRPGLGLLDRLVLLLAWVATCALVYLLGFYVGKGTNERRMGDEERLVRLPVVSQPPPEGQRAKGASEFTFYDTLAAGERPTTARAAGPPATAAPPPAAPRRPVAAAAPAPPAAHPSMPAAAPPAPSIAPPGHPATAATPVRTATAAEPGTPASPPGVGPGGWSVQANPTRSREEAESLHQQLRGRGYDARIVRLLRNGDTWYRVQVGRFATAEQASDLMRRLREREGVSHVFVGSE